MYTALLFNACFVPDLKISIKIGDSTINLDEELYVEVKNTNTQENLSILSILEQILLEKVNIHLYIHFSITEEAFKKGEKIEVEVEN